MSESEEFIFNNDYCDRVKRFRKETNMSAETMAELLDVPADRYRKYEYRSPLPAYLIAKFCRIVGCDLEHLIIGKSRERTKPTIVARKSSPFREDADLVRRAQEAENTPDELEKLDQFAEAAAKQRSKSQKTGSGRT